MPPSTNSKKRPAPESPPTSEYTMAQQGYGGTGQPNDQYMPWGQGVDAGNFVDPSQYSMQNGMDAQGFTGNNVTIPQYANIPANNTQLTRRPVNRQLVTARPGYDGGNDPWLNFRDPTSMDPQASNDMEENDSDEKLQERAMVAKRDAQSKRKQIPPFVQKLSSFLDKSENTDLIRWSDRGDSFIVLDEDEFAKTLIPELFKHNNYASFVRQLNMYGFHKRVGLSDNSMKASERKNKSPSEYYNPYFKRGHADFLWLINKPKGGAAAKKGKGRVKTEDGGEGSDEEVQDVDESYGYNPAPQRAISAAPEPGPLQRREIALVQNQLADIQKQQSAISNAIARLRKDHNQMYQQAIAFQNLHDQHQTSINAILQFLATVFNNRTIDGQTGPSMDQMEQVARMFSGPRDRPERDVVEMTDLNGGQVHPGSVSPLRRGQRLLMAPPAQTRNTASPVSTVDTPIMTTNQNPSYQSNKTNHAPIEELFENSPSDTPQVKSEPSQQEMMNLINNTNAQNRRPGSRGNGFTTPISKSSPLNTQQGQDMLRLMSNNAGGNSPKNLGSMNQSLPPTMPDLGMTDAQLEAVMRMQDEQNAKIDNVRSMLEPLSPSGSIPGINDGQYFADATIPSPSASQGIDLDQYLDPSAYFGNGDGDFGYDAYGNPIAEASNFDFGLDGGGEIGSGGRIVETQGSSEAVTPETQVVEVPDTPTGQRSPSKRRKRA